MRRYQIDPKIGRLGDSFFIALYPARIHVESRRGNLGFLNRVSCLLIFMTDWSKIFLPTINYTRCQHYSFKSLSA